MPKVFILILHWQKYDITRECLESFKKLDYPNYKIVVLDNASSNDSARRLEQEFPQNLFIFNKENKGYGAGMNPGIKYALDNGADYIFLLNNDVIVSKNDFLVRLINLMESNKKVGIAGPKLLFRDMTYQRSYRNYFFSIALGFWAPEKVFIFFRKIFGILPKDNITHKVDWLNAVALLFKREVFEKIGLMDERFFLGAEDVDLSLSAKNKGWETWYCAESELVHLSFVSHDNEGGAGYDKYWIESTILFLEKHYSKITVFVIRFLIVLGLFLRGLQWSILGLFNQSYFLRAKNFFRISYFSLIIRPRFANK